LSLNCGKEAPNNSSDSNEIVFFFFLIYTVNSSQAMVDAIYIKDGIIKYIGTNEEAKNMASEDANLIDLEGKFMMPGIHDVHMHPLEASSDNFHFIVDETVTDPEDYATEVETALQQNTGTGWLLGWGHHLETILDATRPPKEILDDVAPDRPVAIMEQTSHSIWCNSKALELMGITIDSENPTGGVIMRETNDEPNGILIDNAGNLLIELALQPTTQSEQNDYDGLVEFGLPELAKHGITSVCDARTYWKRNHHKTWIRLANEDKLTARINLGLWAYPTEEDASQLAMLKSLYQNDGNSLLKINQIKLYSDGIIHNTTSAMHDDFLIDYFEEPTNNGLNYFSEQRIGQYIAELESTGFDFHIHTIGNRGIHESLNAIENNGTANGRHRLTHVEFMDAVDIPRFAQLNVTADAQVAGDFTNPMHWHDNDYLVGATLSENIIPLKDLQAGNARITLSSDWDVSSLNPFLGLQNAVTRSPQNISIEEAIKAYTINAAYVMRQEDKVGSIEVGKEADLIILDRNILEINATEIGGTKVEATYLQGEIVFEK
ncbi:MAG: amidohydrolase, partial [Saprospiraceae bacterium]